MDDAKNFAQINENEDYLYVQDKNQLRENKQKMKAFQAKLPDVSESRELIKQQSAIHSRVIKMQNEK